MARVFITIVFCLFLSVAEAQTLSCPAVLGSQFRAGTEIPIRDYYCNDPESVFKCSFEHYTNIRHRSEVSTENLKNCFTEYCSATTYAFFMTSGEGTLPQLDSWCEVYTSLGNGPSASDTSESSCVKGNSHVIVDTLSLEEQIPVQGVSFYLNYSSSNFKIDSRVVPKEIGLGGWKPNVIHAYELLANILHYGSGGQLVRNRNSLSDTSSLYFVVDERSGEIYYFDTWGRHYQTLDALTGAVIYKFQYDPVNLKLTKIIDRYGKETVFQHSINRITITSPRGELTTLNLNTNGMLASVVNRNSEVYRMTYAPRGQLLTFQKPKGQPSTMAYDTDGNIVKDLGPGGDFINFALGSGSTPSNQAANSSTATNLNSLHITTSMDDIVGRSTATPFGETITSRSVRGGEYTVMSTLGPRLTTTRAEDPRYFSYYTQNLRYQIPGTPIDILASTARSVDAANQYNPFAFTTLTTTTTLQNNASKKYTSVYNAQTKTLTKTSPLNRVQSLKYNAQGMISESRVGSLTPITLAYDAYGNVLQVNQGSTRATKYTYDVYNNVASKTDVMGRRTTFAYDKSNRLIQYTLPSGQIGGYGYDANGNLTSVTPPGKTKHTFSYGALELVSSYLPPAISSVVLGNETYEYNLNKDLTKINKSTGEAITISYHASTGLPILISAPSGNMELEYHPSSDLVRYRRQPTSGLNLEYSYLGKILSSVKTSGPLQNQVKYNYNADASLASLQVIGSNNASSLSSFTYDNDGLLIGAGSMVYTRNAVGAVATAKNNSLLTTNTYNASFGELSSAITKYQSAARASFTYVRDLHGRIGSTTEVVVNPSGVSETISKTYGYDTSGRLQSVTQGSNVTTYEYDSNANRTKKISPAGTWIGTYDAQDRLTQYGNIIFSYKKSGERILKTEKIDANPANDKKTQYTYDSFGYLTKVVLPDGKVIEYILDGQKRRVAKKINGAIIEGYIYQSQTQIAAVTNATGVVVKRFVYGEKENVPDLINTGGVTYRIVSDHLGTARQLINISTGKVVFKQTMDEFGNIVSSEGSDLLPFKFAGGLWDADTKLVLFGARDYDPSIGRWLSKDPILFEGGDTNLYGYVLQDPVNWIDPEGKNALAPILAPIIGPIIIGIGIDIGTKWQDFIDPDPLETIGDDVNRSGICPINSSPAKKTRRPQFPRLRPPKGYPTSLPRGVAS